MQRVLVSSRSFGNVVTVGNDLLKDAGLEVQRVREEDRPLDVATLTSYVSRECPTALITGAESVPEPVLTASGDLRMVMKHGVGVDNIDLVAATSRGILVANAPSTNSDAVADLAVGLMLALLRRICEANASTHAGSWERYVGHDLGKSVVGVVGTGQIGAAVARRVHAFGARLLGYDIVRDERLESACGMCYVSLDRLLSEADIVTLHAPLLPATLRMIGTSELELMKPSAFLINCARGEIVDEVALCAALRSGKLAGAAFDVFATEPPQDSPLLELDGVIATPHIAAYTYEAMEAMDRLCAQTVIDVLRHGALPPNVLNPEAT